MNAPPGASGEGHRPRCGSGLYEERLAEYERYSADPNYRDVAFDRSTLGLKATHVRHTLNSEKGWYKTAAQNAGFKSGHSVILEEDHTMLNKKNTEGLWDGLKFEVAGAEKRNIEQHQEYTKALRDKSRMRSRSHFYLG